MSKRHGTLFKISDWTVSSTHRPRNLRADAGNDSEDNLKVCQKANVDYLIKHNRRNKSVDAFLDDAQGIELVIER